METQGRDKQIEQLLEELLSKRAMPDALRISDIADDARGEVTQTDIPTDNDIKKAPAYSGQRQPSSSRPQYQEITSTAEFNFIKPVERDREKERLTASNAKLAKRDVIAALSAGDVVADKGQINKQMLAPQWGSGSDLFEKEAREKRIAHAIEKSDKDTPASFHPLFTKSHSKEMLIPQEDSDNEILRAERARKFATSEMILDGIVRRSNSSGVLNVKDNLDDDFREFFGDTVVIDQQSLSEKAKKPRKLMGYSASADKGDIGEPIFEEDGEDSPIDENEYRTEEESEMTLRKLTRRQEATKIRMIVMAVLALFSCCLSLAAELGGVPAFLSTPALYYGTQLFFILSAVAIQYQAVFLGLLKLFAFKAEPPSFGAFAALLSVAESVVLFAASPQLRGLFGSVMILAYAGVEAGNWVNTRRILFSFKTIAEMNDKVAISPMENDSLAHSISRGADVNVPRVLVRRPTGFAEQFIYHSHSADEFRKKIAFACAASVFLTIACAVVSYLSGADVSGILRSACGCSVLCFPFSATLTSFLPLSRMHLKLFKSGSVIPGYSAVRSVAQGNCIVLSGRDLFPKGNVLLHGIKTFERERIDNAILYAASVIVQSCDTMAPMFLNVIQHKTEMLYPINDVEYEEGLGFCYWIDKKRILLGTRELLLKYNVEAPSLEYESRYTKTNARDAIYLAVSGSLFAMLVISYSANELVGEALRSIEQEGLHILVHTRDFNITADRIARLYKTPVKFISLVRKEESAEITQRTEYAPHAPSIMTSIPSLMAFAKGYTASKNVQTAVQVSSLITFIGVLIGMAIALVLTLLNALSTVGMMPVLLFQTIWCLLIVLTTIFRRY